ncbi:lipoate--protein ligase family protein [Phormidium sp. LEGE 05292]|uniref:lipoate--protein ligase family protein n=1 Tax=[Phormidium] sp. LEGE 05292 TaxID=767427 RepID=UPI00187F28AB|nr:biotin/lipoate A/B protein ligase family protein [Phormidium sp. LEGE 05292]MBE9227205.1 lipoate--protein ligase family protein [Phormidium sp. LEGE 05292]
MTNDKFRLIPLLEASGKVQMAIDEWLLEQHRLGLHPPALRFYTWSPAAISLGYHQRRWPDFWENLSWENTKIDLVRRPTGGRAVLHQGDLTYAVITSGISGSRMQVYQKLCEFLIVGWRSLGVNLHYGTAGRGYIHNPNCFATATGADLLLDNGSKLIGSAQVYRDGAILQHGSMLLQPDRSLFSQVFPESAPPTINLPINQPGKSLISCLIQALITAAETCFNTQLLLHPLSDLEWQSIYTQLDRDSLASN